MEKHKTGSIKGGGILVLPSHLILDILSRLSIETIFSCKCVCRSFLEVLTDPYFVELHLTKAPNIDDGLIIQDRNTISDFFLVYNNRPEIEKSGTDKANCNSRPCQTLAVPTNASSYHNKGVYIVGSCNGLLCLRYSDQYSYSRIFYICNPILGEFLAIAPDIQHKYVRAEYKIEYCGFGFDPKTKQYKVIRILSPSNSWIYTLGTECWRKLHDAPMPRNLASFDSSLNGNLHWITKSTKISNLICSFNLESEQFSYISPPAQFNPDVLGKIIYLSIGLLGGLFCLCHDLGARYEVFVMKDYGLEGHWTKKFSVDLTYFLNLQGLGNVFLLHGILNNGELVLQYDMSTIICYDILKGTTRCMLGVKNVARNCYNVLSFVPSFISLKNMTGAVVGDVEVVQRKMVRNLWPETGYKFVR